MWSIALATALMSTAAALAAPPSGTVPTSPPDPLLAAEPITVDHEHGDLSTPLLLGLPASDDRCPASDAGDPSHWHLLFVAERVDVAALELDLFALEQHDDATGFVGVVETVSGDLLFDEPTSLEGRPDLADAVHLRPQTDLTPGRHRLALVCEQGGAMTRRWELPIDVVDVNARTLDWRVVPAPPERVEPTGPDLGGPDERATPAADTVPEVSSEPVPDTAPVSSGDEVPDPGSADAPIEDPDTPTSTTTQSASGDPAAVDHGAEAIAPMDPVATVEPEPVVSMPALPPATVTIEDIPPATERDAPTLPGAAERFDAVVPSNALVVVQRCGVHGALPSEPADGGFPALAAIASRTMPSSGATASAGSSGGCAAHLGTASLVMSGPLAGQYYVAAGAIDTISVVDTRRLASGFSLSGVVGTFTSDRDRFDGRLLGLTPVVSVEGASLAATTTVLASQAIAPGEGAGLASARMLAVAPAGIRVGTLNLDARLKVMVPVTAAAGTYSATLSITAI